MLLVLVRQRKIRHHGRALSGYNRHHRLLPPHPPRGIMGSAQVQKQRIGQRGGDAGRQKYRPFGRRLHNDR